MAFHTCLILPKSESNPTGQDLYLVCVTVPLTPVPNDGDEEASGADKNQEARMMFFDYQQALGKAIRSAGLNKKELSLSLSRLMQLHGESLWMPDFNGKNKSNFC